MFCSETIVQDIETNSFRNNVSYHQIFIPEGQLLSFRSDHRALFCIENISNLTYLYASLLHTRKLFHKIQLKMENLFCNVISCIKLFSESNTWRMVLGSIVGPHIDQSGVSSCRQTLNPILLLRQLLKSDIISDTGTLSCGLLGPEQQGTTVDKSNSTTCV